MTIGVLHWAFDVPVKNPAQRAILLFLADMSFGDKVVFSVKELCELIPIEKWELVDALEVLCAAAYISVRLPLNGDIQRVTLNLPGYE